MKQVAEALSISVMTVSNAWNHPEKLSAALRGRILAEAERLGHRGPDPLARSLRTGTTGTVGLVLNETLLLPSPTPH